MSMSTVKRPGVVTFIGVILLIQAFLALVSAVVVFALRDDIVDYLSDQGGGAPSNSELTGDAIGSIIAAVLLFLVGSGLLRGSRGWRLFAVIVTALNMAFSLYVMIIHPHEAFVTSGLVTLLIGVFVIWALYGHEKSEEFFESTL